MVLPSKKYKIDFTENSYRWITQMLFLLFRSFFFFYAFTFCCCCFFFVLFHNIVRIRASLHIVNVSCGKTFSTVVFISVWFSSRISLLSTKWFRNKHICVCIYTHFLLLLLFFFSFSRSFVRLFGRSLSTIRFDSQNKSSTCTDERYTVNWGI